VAIFSAVGIRDDAMNAELGRALQKNPFPRLTSLRRDAHDRDDKCWLHGSRFCLS
jgi:protein-L-isoaspartate(D-aspartate) O-methyltransferase